MTRRLLLLGAHCRFDSNSAELMRLVDAAFARLPGHRLSNPAPRLRVSLLLASTGRLRKRADPAPLAMLSGGSLIGGATGASDAVIVSPREQQALVTVSRRMLKFAYHTRYEMIEFAVFTLAARAQGLVPLHAACVGRGGRGILLMGPSGAGKSTVALQCLLRDFEFLSEDSVFVEPDSLRATGIANFLHVRADSLRWVESDRDAAALRNSPVIRRRSGVKKFELDLRGAGYRLAAAPLEIGAVVFLSPRTAARGRLLKPLGRTDSAARMTAAQAYAAAQPSWRPFMRRISGLEALELRRGSHPLEAVEALETLLGERYCASR